MQLYTLLYQYNQPSVLNPTNTQKEKFCMFTRSFIATTVLEANTEIQYKPKYDLTEQFKTSLQWLYNNNITIDIDILYIAVDV